MNRRFRNPKAAVYLILAFVALLLLLFSVSARAQDLHLEAGSAVLRGEPPTFGLNAKCPECGPVLTDYE